MRQIARAESNRKPSGNRRVIAFPAFERYEEQIEDWLSAIGERTPGARPSLRVLRSIQRTLAEVERVRNSPRHSNLASFLRHAANAIHDMEWDGARYILMTALAVSDWAHRGCRAPVRQLPVV